MYRGNFTGDELLAKIKDVKAAVPQFKVGTADSWNKYQDGTADPLIKGGADILLCNAFSYWQGQTIGNATKSFFDDIMQAFGHIQATAGSIDKAPELWVGETGKFTHPFCNLCAHLGDMWQIQLTLFSFRQDGQALALHINQQSHPSRARKPFGLPESVAFLTGELMCSLSRLLMNHGSRRALARMEM